MEAPPLLCWTEACCCRNLSSSSAAALVTELDGDRRCVLRQRTGGGSGNGRPIPRRTMQEDGAAYRPVKSAGDFHELPSSNMMACPFSQPLLPCLYPTSSGRSFEEGELRRSAITVLVVASCCRTLDVVAATGELDRKPVELVRASGPWRAGKYGENGENSSHEVRMSLQETGVESGQDAINEKKLGYMDRGIGPGTLKRHPCFQEEGNTSPVSAGLQNFCYR